MLRKGETWPPLVHAHLLQYPRFFENRSYRVDEKGLNIRILSTQNAREGIQALANTILIIWSLILIDQRGASQRMPS